MNGPRRASRSLAAIAAAIARSQRVPEAVVALGGAALLVVAGVLSWGDAVDEAGDLAPTLVVLASLLVLGDGCERAGLFDALAARMAAGARGSGARLLALVFAAAVAVTAVLGLDATVVLLTPAAFAAAAKARLPARPHVYACTHLANSSSLMLPISNLTNLLAFHATGLTFARFARADGAAVGGGDRDRVGRVALGLRRRDRGARARRRAPSCRRCPRCRWPSSR